MVLEVGIIVSKPLINVDHVEKGYNPAHDVYHS
jgi:hypothetical protein